MNPENRLSDDVNNHLSDTAHNIADHAATDAQAALHTVSDEAARASADLRRTLRSNANAAKEKASDSLLSAAESIRHEAQKSKNEEVVRQAQTLARSMEKAALYLDSRSIDQLGEDAKETIRENVWPTVGIMLFIGFLFGRLMGGGRRHHR